MTKHSGDDEKFLVWKRKTVVRVGDILPFKIAAFKAVLKRFLIWNLCVTISNVVFSHLETGNIANIILLFSKLKSNSNYFSAAMI